MEKDNIIYPGIEYIFLKALDYPAFARPEYFIKEQMKSDWGKGVFLTTLFGIHEHYKIKLQISSAHQKRKLEKENRKLPDDFGLDLEKETDGQQNGKLTKKLLEELRFSIEYAYKLNKEQPVFDSYHILSFCERILVYIKSEFEEQIKKTSSARYVAEKFRKEGQLIEGNPEYLTYHYNIISEAPVADFHRFRNEVRKLLLTSANPLELKTMLKPLHNISVEIVDIWNERLYLLDEPPTEKERLKAIRDQRLIVFDHEDLKIWIRNIYSPEDFYKEPSKHLMNRDFASFAAKVANFISSEVLKNTKNKKEYKIDNKEYADFDELFKNSAFVTPCYEVLINEELIGKDNNYTGGLKSAFCLWAITLNKSGITHFASDAVLTRLLNQKFSGLNMNNSNFRTGLTTAKRKFESTQ